jgi:hypothetical protein
MTRRHVLAGLLLICLVPAAALAAESSATLPAITPSHAHEIEDLAFVAQTLSAQERRPSWLSHFKVKAAEPTARPRSREDQKKIMDEAALLEKTRKAGLLTDWHLEGRFGGGEGDFARRFAPEKAAAKEGARRDLSEPYELVFPEGSFALPPALASAKGVFYANSRAYLSSSGEWNVYMESGAEAVVFFDGRRVLERAPEATGVMRGKVHAESGYHSVMVKFTAVAAPFRVAILPPNSGSRRKNNTPYLQASPASEEIMAKEIGGPLTARGY